MRTAVHIHPEAKKEMLALERKASFALLTLFKVLPGGEILPKSKKLSGYYLY